MSSLSYFLMSLSSCVPKSTLTRCFLTSLWLSWILCLFVVLQRVFHQKTTTRKEGNEKSRKHTRIKVTRASDCANESSF